MAQRTVDPTKIKTLADWVARWPKATNLGFDAETREPTVYDTSKARAKVQSIPWKREADTLTILGQPARFSVKAIATATARYTKLQEQKTQQRQAAEDQIRLAEKSLLDARRTYRESPPAVRGPLRGDILAAESAIRELELSMADKGRMLVTLPQGTAVYVPPMPVKRRGVAMEDTL